ncbi:MAG TPA: flagellar motor protein MotD [Solimonas sp.]
MAKKHKHEDHVNHEAWAIPYGDLITLLLAFFVVMYAVSSVNEGKYRVLADSLSQAFGGPPKSMKPVQIGNNPEKGAANDSLLHELSLRGFEREQSSPTPLRTVRAPPQGDASASGEAGRRAAETLERMSDAVEAAMHDLIRQRMIVVRRSEHWLEIEISTDILYASGVARLAPEATPVLQRLAEILRPFPNPIRIEGHTDNVPIATVAFPSNWELSAARAASVVHLFMASGVAPTRMTVIGFGEYRPTASNADTTGRNRNRRVVVVVMAHGEEPVALEPDMPASPVSPTSQREAQVADRRGAALPNAALGPDPSNVASARPASAQTPVQTSIQTPSKIPAQLPTPIPASIPAPLQAQAPAGNGLTVIVPAGTLAGLAGGAP